MASPPLKVNTGDTLLTQVADFEVTHEQKIKVTIVGAGQVGMAIAFAILNQVSVVYYLFNCTSIISLIAFFNLQNLVGELVMMDAVAEKVKGEVMDLQHGITFLKPAKVTGSTTGKLLLKF
jgi:L-lactate dehydrogenase